MRLLFLLLLFAGAVFYSWIAYLNLPFLTTSGRLGPGFFPRIVGFGLLIFAIWSVAEEIVARKRAAETGEIGMDRAVFTVIGIGAVYVVTLSTLGGVLGTMLFLLAALSVFNAGEYLRNTLVTIGVPLLVYTLFVILLNADMPDGILPLPF